MAKEIVETTPPQILEPSVQFDPSRFEKLIYDKGYEVYVEKALRCPCLNIATGQALTTCQNCLGFGWFFINRKQTRLVAQSLNFDKKYENWSEVTHGTARITARGVDRLAFMDKLIMIELEAYFSEVIVLKENNGKAVAYPVYTPLEIQEIYSFVGTDKKLGIVPETDYTIVDNSIQFIDKYKGKKDYTISIRYIHNPVYHIIDMNRELMKVRTKECKDDESQLKQMPINCLAKKAHFIWDRTDKNRYGLLDNTNA